MNDEELEVLEKEFERQRVVALIKISLLYLVLVLGVVGLFSMLGSIKTFVYGFFGLLS